MQSEYQKLKVEKKCGKDTFKIFPLLQIRSSKLYLQASYKKYFRKKQKAKLSYLNHKNKTCIRLVLRP